MMRSALLAALMSAVLPTMAFAQTADDLKNDEKTPGRRARLRHGLFRTTATARSPRSTRRT